MSSTPSPPESVRAQRRAEIVEEARKLIAEGGVEALTIGRLEKRLAYTRGVITYHFENKDDIVDAVLASAVDEIDRATFEGWDSTAPMLDQVRTVLETKIRGFLEHPEATSILLAFWARPSADPRTMEVNRKLFRNYRRQATVMVEASGAPVDVGAMATLLVATVIGVVTQVQLDPRQVRVDAVVREASLALALRMERRAPGGE